MVDWSIRPILYRKHYHHFAGGDKGEIEHITRYIDCWVAVGYLNGHVSNSKT